MIDFKWLWHLLVINMLFLPFLQAEPLPIRVKSKYALLMNAHTGKILYAKNAYEKINPASTTKLATLLYILHAFPNLDLESTTTVLKEDVYRISEKIKLENQYELPAFWLENDGKNIGLKAGEVVPIKTLIYALMLHSANDAANVLARHFYGNIDEFMYHMNLYLQEIGCHETQLLNPHGLYIPNHYSTPYDLAIIAKEALKYDLLRKVVSTKEYLCPPTNKSPARLLRISNHLLHEGSFYYPKATGMKRGYTRLAGHSLIATAENGERELIAIVNKLSILNQIYRDVMTMFDTAFEEKTEIRTLYNAAESAQLIPLKGCKEGLKTALLRDIVIEYFPSEEPLISSRFIWYPIQYPIEKGSKRGEVQILDEMGNLIAKEYFIALESRGKPWILVITPILSSYLTWMGVSAFILIFLTWCRREKRWKSI